MSEDIPEPVDVTDPALDPDVATADASLDEPDDPGELATDGLVRDPDEDGYDPPDAPSTPTAAGYTGADEAGEETIDERLAQEEPEPDPYSAGAQQADHDLRET